MDKQHLFDYLPHYYRESQTVDNIVGREAEEFTRLNADVQDVLDQYFIDSATWGLAIWERICGIPTDVAKPLEQRRSVIKSKLRGVGTVTVALVKSVAEAYHNGEVEVTEDFADLTIVVTFVSKLGNLEDIENALREIIPAHLAIRFEFTYMIWAALDSYGLTWADVDALDVDWAEWETYKQ